MDKLTPEQEDLINDCHEKRLMDDWGIDELVNKGGVMILQPKKEEKEHKTIPINPDKFDEILIGIGRKKPNPKEIKEVKVNE